VHVKNILAKLKVQDRTAAVSVAVRRGIFELH
jgi:DNA-binding NarL/FixJ family response regulator